MPDAGNTISVTLDRLRSVAPEFRMASQETFYQISTLNQVTSNLLNEMYSAQLTRSSQALDELWSKWRDALTNLAYSMETVANNLEIAAEGYQYTDQNVMPHNP